MSNKSYSYSLLDEAVTTGFTICANNFVVQRARLFDKYKVQLSLISVALRCFPLNLGPFLIIKFVSGVPTPSCRVFVVRLANTIRIALSV